MHKYKSLGRVGEGTFSEVLKAQSIKTGPYMAIKCMKHGAWRLLPLPPTPPPPFFLRELLTPTPRARPRRSV